METHSLIDHEAIWTEEDDNSNHPVNMEESTNETEETEKGIPNTEMEDDEVNHIGADMEVSVDDTCKAEEEEECSTEMEFSMQTSEIESTAEADQIKEAEDVSYVQPMDDCCDNCDEGSEDKKPPIAKVKGKARVVLIGNPGAGKSTILSSIVGEQTFTSGISLGGGLTSEMKMKDHEGTLYVDTPGLDDILSREKAGKEISKALSNVNQLKIIFVATLESQYVRSGDLVTMKLITNALSSVGVDVKSKFGLIINKCDVQLMDNITKHERIRRHIINPFRALGIQSDDQVLFVMSEDHIHGKRNKFISEKQVNNINKLISTTSVVSTKSKKVRVNLQSFEGERSQAGVGLRGFRKVLSQLIQNPIGTVAKIPEVMSKVLCDDD